MDPSRRSQTPSPPWHALLAPLPADAVPRRKPVAPPEVLATPEGAAIAGWEQLTIELSAGAAGLRHVLVVLDAAGQPISACDWVLYRSEVPKRVDAGDAASPIEYEIEVCHESVGGRIEPDGTFRGTRWRSVGIEPVGADEPQLESTPSEPSAADAESIKGLVAEVMRRLPNIGPPNGPHEV